MWRKNTFVAKILMEMSDTISLDVADKDKRFLVQENPFFVAVVNPKETSSQAPSYARWLQPETAPTYQLTDGGEV